MSQAVFLAAAVKYGEAIEEDNSRIANKQSAVIRKLWESLVGDREFICIHGQKY